MAESRIDGKPAQELLAELRVSDRIRYLACLLSPEDKREALAALYTFNAEVASVRDRVREALPGEMRLQYWRDVLTGGESDNASPLARALIRAIEIHQLPLQPFTDLLEARSFDLYDDPMPDRGAFELYAGETASAVIQLASLILAPDEAVEQADRAGHAGVAQAVAGLILLLPRHRARGQIYLPGDLLSAVGLDRDGFLDGKDSTRLQAAIEAFAGLGRDHLRKAFVRGKVGPALRPAFLPVAFAQPVLELAARQPHRVLDGRILPSGFKNQWWIFKASLTGHFGV